MASSWVRRRESQIDPPEARVSTSEVPWSVNKKYSGWVGYDAPPYPSIPTSHVDTPVVFIHGNGRTADDWENNAHEFQQRGYGSTDIWAITFKHAASTHDEMATQLDDFISNVRQYTDSSQVDVVAHSLGVTGVRHWLAVCQRYDWVRKFIGIAGANHGIPALSVINGSNLDDRWKSILNYLRPPHTDENTPLQKLNENETPGDVDYYTLYGTFDRYFIGNLKSPCLKGAEQNIRLSLTHDGVQKNPRAIDKIYSLLAKQQDEL